MQWTDRLVVASLFLATPALGQSLNIDFGEADSHPPPTYAAAGLAGVWNSFPALHGTSENDLLGLDGQPTGARLLQLGGFENLHEHDPAISGDDALLMDDFLVTYNAALESCIFFDDLEPGEYEVLVYARMPDPAIGSYTSVDQEVGIPHYEVGGAWPGGHQELVSFSRHFVTVGADGNLDLHSGIVPGADPLLGAALNGIQLILAGPIFSDGFESGDTSSWDG